MNTETIQQLQKEIHAMAIEKGWAMAVEKGWAMAVEKGWWPDGKRDPDEVFTLMHSELSEAFEEWRNGRRETEIYWTRDEIEMVDSGLGYEMDWAKVGHKPKGVPVELADCVIRILDAAEAWGWQLLSPFYPPLVLSRLVCVCHYRLGRAWNLHSGSQGRVDEYAQHELSLIVACIAAWFAAHGLDLEATIRLKMAYSATRPERHGGKRA